MFCKRFTHYALVFLLIAAICVGMVACGSSSTFSMFSDDTVGATRHYVVGGKTEPSGNYKVVCTRGHGTLIVIESDIYIFSADEYIGKEYSGLTYVESAVLKLNANDVLKARAYNSSEFKLEFTYSGK